MSAEEFITEIMESKDDLKAADAELRDSLLKTAKEYDKHATSAKKEAAARRKSAGSFDDLNDTMRDSIDEQEEYNEVVEASQAIWNTMTGAVTRTADVLEAMSKDLMGGEGLGMFRKLIEPIGDLLEGMGKVMGDVVGGLIKMGGVIPGTEAIFDTLGETAAGAGEALGKVAATAFKFVANLTLDATEQLWDMFKGAASAGLLVVGGLETMHTQAKALNLSTAEYTSLIKSQAENMANFGGSVSAGAEKLKAVAEGAESQRKELRRMGIEYEEQYEMTTDFMSNLQRSGHLRLMTDQQIRDASFEYMKNLRVVSALTGKSAEDMKKDRDAALQNIAFQAKLAKMDPAVRVEMEAALGAMPEGMQQAFKESVIFGKVMTDTGAIVSGTAPIISKMANSIANGGVAFEEGFQTFRDDLKAAAPEIRNNMNSLAAAGMAALVGKDSTASRAINEFGATIYKVLGQVEEGTKFDVAQAKSAGTKAGETVENITNMMDTQRKLMQTLLDEAKALMPAVTEGMDAMMTAGKSMFEQMRGEAEGGAKGGGGPIVKGLIDDGVKVFNDIHDWAESAFKKFEKAITEFGTMLAEIKKSYLYQKLFGKSEAKGIEMDPVAKMQQEKENLGRHKTLTEGFTNTEIEYTKKELADLRAEIARMQLKPGDDNRLEPRDTSGWFGGPTRAEEEKELVDKLDALIELQTISNANQKKQLNNEKLRE
jgi:hypothetical protein